MKLKTQRTAKILGLIAVAMTAAGCTSDPPPPPEPAEQAAPAASDSPGLRATEKFMETWNARDPEAYASSLNYPHARPSGWKFDEFRPHRIWQTQDDYVGGVDYAKVIATGWESTEFEELQPIHEGDGKAHIAGRWGRVDAEGNKTGRNLVTYVATQVDGYWGVQARFHAGAPVEAELQESNAEIAVAKVEEYMTAFNARDPQAWASTLHFPHLRLASGEVVVTETEEEFVADMDFDAFAERFGWDHSAWDEIEAIQVAENAANVALTFSRYNAAGEVISTFNTLYLVTKENDKWGISARSSFAP